MTTYNYINTYNYRIIVYIIYKASWNSSPLIMVLEMGARPGPHFHIFEMSKCDLLGDGPRLIIIPWLWGAEDLFYLPYEISSKTRRNIGPLMEVGMVRFRRFSHPSTWHICGHCQRMPSAGLVTSLFEICFMD